MDGGGNRNIASRCRECPHAVSGSAGENERFRLRRLLELYTTCNTVMTVSGGGVGPGTPAVARLDRRNARYGVKHPLRVEHFHAHHHAEMEEHQNSRGQR